MNASKTKACLIACCRDGDRLAHKDARVLGRHLAPMIAGVMQQARRSRCDVAAATRWDFQVPAQGGSRDLEDQMVGQYLSWLPDALVRSLGKVMMILLLFLQKQNLAFAVYQFGSVLSLPD